MDEFKNLSARDLLRIEVNMNKAREEARLSTCRSTQVGALFEKDKVVLATGYNGVGAGHPHCNELEQEMTSLEHKQYSDDYEIHAEMNAFINAADTGASIRGATLYCTHSPCGPCLKHLERAGVKNVIYLERYWRLSDEALNTLKEKYPRINLIHYDYFKNYKN